MKPTPHLNESGLYDYAVKALGRRMRTETELRRLMVRRVEPGQRGEEVIRTVIANLKDRHYLDDQSYAETYARLRKENDKFGQRRVRQSLLDGCQRFLFRDTRRVGTLASRLGETEAADRRPRSLRSCRDFQRSQLAEQGLGSLPRADHGLASARRSDSVA